MRGWTLQELLAPSVVEFFSCEWYRLGDRLSLKSQIHEVTTIPQEVLEGASLFQYSVDERFRWRQHRDTKLKEDAAYSLSGIFNVDIAPVYGEGEEEAFKRLHDKTRSGSRKSASVPYVRPAPVMIRSALKSQRAACWRDRIAGCLTTAVSSNSTTTHKVSCYGSKADLLSVR
jgi:hypothetical protein